MTLGDTTIYHLRMPTSEKGVIDKDKLLTINNKSSPAIANLTGTINSPKEGNWSITVTINGKDYARDNITSTIDIKGITIPLGQTDVYFKAKWSQAASTTIDLQVIISV